jgi:FKBP-type peptidyl-prolyl cis-trans isomerase
MIGMKKMTAVLLVCLLAAGCASAPQSTETAAATASAAAEASTAPAASTEPAASAEATEGAHAPADVQTLDGVLEKDLPQTLTVTIQDLEVIFTKDLSFQETGKLEAGQEITVTYTGSLDSHPTALSAAAK